MERYHRTFNEECLEVYRPADLEAVKTHTAQFQQHYNNERPHQGLACQNRPPRVAFPNLPPRPPVPELVDPDRWLSVVDGQCYTRRVGRDGLLRIDSSFYYVSSKLSGQVVVFRIDAGARQFVVEHNGQEVKRLAIRGVGSGPLPFAAYVERMQAEARSDAVQRSLSRQQLRLPLEG